MDCAKYMEDSHVHGPRATVDTINHYKKKGHPEYQKVYIDYGFMSQAYDNQSEDDQNSGSDHKQKSTPQYSQINIQKLSPQYSDIGLSNTVILAGKIFNGEEVKEDTNIITKLRTHSSQHYPEKEDGSSWCVDPSHLIQALRFWKTKNHVCLRGIRFRDILDIEKKSSLTHRERKNNEKKVIKSWKYFTSKPYYLLARYHKDLLRTLGIKSAEDFEEWISK